MKICCVELGNILHGFTPTGTLQSRALLLLNIVRLGNILDGFTKGVQLKNGLIFVISTTTMEKEIHIDRCLLVGLILSQGILQEDNINTNLLSLNAGCVNLGDVTTRRLAANYFVSK